MHTCYTNIKKPATGFIGGRLLRIGTREDFLQRNERVTVEMDFSLCHGDRVRINEQGHALQTRVVLQHDVVSVHDLLDLFSSEPDGRFYISHLNTPRAVR
jgi:hypothetical protein